jgi:hypothetical protein
MKISLKPVKLLTLGCLSNPEKTCECPEDKFLCKKIVILSQ